MFRPGEGRWEGEGAQGCGGVGRCALRPGSVAGAQLRALADACGVGGGLLPPLELLPPEDGCEELQVC